VVCSLTHFLLITYLLFFLSGLNDPAPAAGKEASENSQWSVFEVARREFLRGRKGGLAIVGGLMTHFVTLEKHHLQAERLLLLRGSLA